MALVTLIQNIRRRPPEHGRIRYGERFVGRNGKSAMRALTQFRFTSPDRNAIEQIAALYGGEARPWSDPKASPQNQFEVYTEASRIKVMLPVADCYTMAYEQWGGRGIERRCDGQTCTFYGAGPPMERDCMCQNQAQQTCKPYSRVNVIMPGVDLGGVWRLEVKGQSFMHEGPGMLDLILSMSEGGMASCDIMLTKRSTNGKHYVVPQFVMPYTPEQILAGHAQVRRLPSAAHAHPSVLPARAELAPVPDLDDEVVDGELVEDSWYEADTVEDGLADLLERSVEQARERKLHAVPNTVEGWDDHNRPLDRAIRRNPDPNGPKWIPK